MLILRSERWLRNRVRRCAALGRRALNIVLIVALVLPGLGISPQIVAATEIDAGRSDLPAAAALAEPTWADFQPAGWAATASPTCSVMVTDPDGLQPGTAEYEFSTDAGASWSGWTNVGLSAYGSISTTLAIAVTGLTFVESNAANQIHFRIADTNAVSHTSSTYPVDVDLTAPALPTAFSSTSHITSTWSTNNVIAVSWSGATDALSGVGGYALVWDLLPTTLPVPITTTVGLSATSPALADGNSHYAHLLACDNAGNCGTTALHLGPFYIDTQAPPAPEALLADPDTWTQQNQFALFWSQPVDASGIAGAYYKLDAAPTANADGTWVAGDNLSMISNIAVAGDGAHTAYVWLQDKLGNVDFTRYATATLLYNGSAPGAPLNLTAAPGAWTNVNSFGVTWTNPADASGITGAYYRQDTAPAGPVDGTLVTGANLHSLSNITVAGSGAHVLYVWLRNGAGGLDQTHAATVTLAYDATPPTPSAVFTSTTHLTRTWSISNTIQVNWSAAGDAHSGVGGYALVWDQSPSTVPPAITTTLGLTGTSPALADGNAHYAHLRTRDVAGNWTAGALHLGPFYIDRQAPAAPLALAANPSGWTNQNQFTVTWTNPSDLSGIAGAYYKLDAAPTSAADGTFVAGDNLATISSISVSGNGEHTVYVWLRDKAGNADQSRSATTLLRYNNAGLGAPLNLAATPAGWSGANAFTLTWTNPDAGPAGIAGAYYKLDSAPTSASDGTLIAGAGIQSIGGVSVIGDGQHTVYVWLRDGAGNADHNNRAQTILRYDSTPPTGPTVFTSTTHIAGVWSPSASVQTTWSGAADALSGVAGYALVWDQNASTLPAPVTSTLGLTATSPLLSDGNNHYAHLRTRDAAGNWTAGALHLGPFFVDTQAPAAPIGLIVDPNGWTNQNQFLLSWINPTELSGIAGAYYKLDVPPTSNAEGTFVAGDGRTTLPGVSVVGDGVHAVYVWLKDKAGNADFTRHATALLRLNGTPPEAPVGLTAAPIVWTNVNSFTASWSNPSGLSAIAGAYYKLDTAPTSNTDGTFVAGVNLQTIANISVAGDGDHALYVWLKDELGNVNAARRSQASLRYDSMAPTSPNVFTSTTHFASTWSNVGSVAVRWSGALDLRSGVYGYALVWDQNPSTLPPAITTTLAVTATSPALADGNDYYAHLRTRDSAGNWTAGALHLGPFYIDLQAPAAPISMAALPITWTNTNLFTVTWTNPADLSGVAGAYYTLDAAPTGDFDGTWVAGEGLSSLANLQMPSNGIHTIYVWLRDKAGNVDHTRDATATVYYNGTGAGVPIGLIATPDTWTKTNSFTLSWTNPTNVSGIAGAYYKLDNAPATATDGTFVAGSNLQSIANVSVSADGVHTAYVWLKDGAGNVDHNNRAQTTLRYDGTPPALSSVFTSTTHIAATWSFTNTVQVRWGEALDSYSGLNGYAFVWDQITNTVPAQITTTLGLTATSPTLSDGNNYYAHLRARDNAGNWSDARHLGPFYIDTQAPAVPLSLTADPPDWTSQNQFLLFWINPSDLAGIAGAYYKLDAPPTYNADGAWTPGDNRTMMTNVTVSGDGAHTAYVWLKDKAGNVDYTRYATATLLYDATPPDAPIGLAAMPADWTSTNRFDLRWTNPAGAAPITGAYFKLDTPPTSAGDGTLVSSAGIQVIFNVRVTGDGSHPVYVWLRDAAGNADYTKRSQTTLRYDTTAPALPAVFTSTTHLPATWSNDPTVDVRWTAADDDGGSGVSGYALAWDQTAGALPAAITTTVGLTATSPVLADGAAQYAHLRARDNVGNWTASALHLGPFYIDTQIPGAPISLTVTPAGWSNVNRFTLNWVNPSDLSGIAGAYVKFDVAPTGNVDGIWAGGDNLSSLPNVTVDGDGAHTIYVWLKDKAGNLDYTHYATATLLYNGTVAGGPINLTATPAGWTNANSFNLSWTNPSNAAGIVGAYYKLDSLPASPNDGYYVAFPNIQAILNIQVPADGSHPVYVWLKDAAGNVDQTKFAQTWLRYDGIAPSLPGLFTSSSHLPATWSNDPTVDARWTEAFDAHSGINGYALVWDQIPGTLPAAITTTIALTGTSATLADGTSHYAHLRARDNAGNWTATGLHLGPFYIDTQVPAAPISLTVTPATWTNQNQFALAWTNPPDLSGIAGAYYRLDAAPISSLDGTFVSGENLATIPGITVNSDGAHTIYVWLKDKAGNLDYTRYATATLLYNGTVAGGPINLTATPAGWTATNSFNLAWTNPPNAAGWVGAYFKLDTLPTFATDGACVASAGIQSILNIRVSGDGAHPVFVWLKDAAGNVDHTKRAQTTLYYDSTAPTLPGLFTSTSHSMATWSNDPTVDVSWSAALDAGSGLGGYALAWDQITNTLPAAITTTLGLSGTSPALADGNGQYAHLRARDSVGNWTATALHLGPFYIDTQAPGAPISVTVTPATWSHGPFTVTWTNPVDLSGIAGVYYRLDTPPVSNFDGTYMSGSPTALVISSISSDGAHSVYIWLKDRAGNLDYTHSAMASLLLDTTPPGAPSFLTPEPEGWTNVNDFSLSWTNPPDPAGIAGAYYRFDAPPTTNTDGAWTVADNQISDISVPNEGEHQTFLWLKDRAGNIDYRTRNVAFLHYDASPPTTTVSVTGTLGLSPWYTATVNGSLTAQDLLSGVDQTRYRINGGAWQMLSAFSLTPSAVYTVEYTSSDKAGNQEPIRTRVIGIDNQPPTTTLAKQGGLGHDGWYTSTVQATLVIVDAVSGPGIGHYRIDGGAWQTGTAFALSTDGVHQIEYYGQDAAGNREAVRTDSVRVDIQTPATSLAKTGTQGDNAWFIAPVTVTLSATDLASGVDDTFYRVDAGAWTAGTRFTVSGEDVHNIQFYSTDQAGNAESVKTGTVNIDTTAPSPPFNLDADPKRRWTNTNAFTITWNSLADLSGIAGAYYKLDADPNNKYDGAYRPGATESITNVVVTGEGKHTVYLWLRDGAGNVNHLTRNVLSEALWLDTTPPTTTHTLSRLPGPSGWYTAPVTVTLGTQDALSGVAGSYYRLDGGEWISGSSFRISTSDRHAVQYYSVDNAGNEEAPNSEFVRVDVDAPTAPLGLRAGPEGWQHTNSFTATWTDPLDTSGVGDAYYTIGAPPTSPLSGTLVSDPQGRIPGIQVPREGKHALYVWLVDNAGNKDYRRYATVPDAFWYDVTPPTTTLTFNGAPGIGGWYRSTGTINLAVQDATSGPASTYYRLNGGAWQIGTNLSLSQDGNYTVEYYSVDQAGNREPTRSSVVKIDTLAPASRVIAPTSYYQPNEIVTVVWSGSDAGSGVLYYDVEYKDGADDTWTSWRTATDETSGSFVGTPGHVYYMRSRARDRAGNVEPMASDAYGDVKFYIERVANGGFEKAPDFASWSVGGLLNKRVVITDTHSGDMGRVALLGNPELGQLCDTQMPKVLPVGAAVISQTVALPGPPDTVAPTLGFWYHIVTYDVVWSSTYTRTYDSFDVEIGASVNPSRTLLFRDGNYDALKTGCWPTPKPVIDLGWRYKEIDLTAYAGQTVTLYFSVNNRVDQNFNTWVSVDDISIVGGEPRSQVFLPLVAKAQEGRLATSGDGAGGTSNNEGEGPPPAR